MLISLDSLVYKYNIKFKGILHIGAHECEEIFFYEKYINRNKILSKILNFVLLFYIYTGEDLKRCLFRASYFKLSPVSDT